MSASMEYSGEQLNYYRICYVATDLLTEGLKTIFKQEWDNRYKFTLGEWEDERRNGVDFWNCESPWNRKRNRLLLTTMIKGDRAEWDCTMLFYAILYSDCIRHGLNPTVKSNVDDLRLFRNKGFAHMPKGHISEPEFQKAISTVDAAFKALGLSSLQLKLQELRNQKSFPTEELRGVLKKVDDLKQELQEKGKELQGKEEQRQALEEQLKSDVSSFCVRPPKPSHTVVPRKSEVAQITQQLKELKNANENSVSYLYISGNPGSGKSQLAGLVAKQFDEVKEATSFVMTLNAENLETLLKSYVTFARQLKCCEYAVTNTVTSKNLTTDQKISNLKTLISPKIVFYTSWLLVVDNVTDLTTMSVFLPDPGNEQWAKGQILITTQDTASIPLTNPFIQHISVSEGMNHHDASSLLATLSGITDGEMENEVAKVLDYQPLKLAIAATFVRQARQDKLTSGFGWSDYLTDCLKLDAGKRSSREPKRAKIDPSYRKSNASVATPAVEQAMRTDRVIGHTFNFLSLCSTQPLHQDIVMNYVLMVDKEFQDKEMIKMRIQNCQLLLFDESKVYIRVHHVVRDAINSVARDFTENGQRKVVVAIELFTQFINTCDPREKLYSLANSKHIVPHLVTLIRNVAHLNTEEGVCEGAEVKMSEYVEFSRNLQKLGRMCEKHCEFEAAKDYFNRALAILLEKLGPKHVEVASAYHTLGILHKQLGDLKEAEDYFYLALPIRMKKLGPKHIDVASSYNQLGELHRHLGDLMIAKDYFDSALVIRLEKLEPDNVDVTCVYINLGNVHTQLGDLKKAEKYFDLALNNIQHKELGPEHVYVATTYTNLGNAHVKMGDLKQAKDYYDRALAIKSAKLGSGHIKVAVTCNNLAYVHKKLGDLKQAKDYYDRALAIWLEMLGPEHARVKTVRSNLAKLQRQEESRSPPDADV